MRRRNQSVRPSPSVFSVSSSRSRANSYRLSLEWLPQNSAIKDRELRLSRPLPNSPSGDIVDVHYAHDVVFSIATALQVGIQLILQSGVHAVSEERRVDADFPLEVAQEEHSGRSWIADSDSFALLVVSRVRPKEPGVRPEISASSFVFNSSSVERPAQDFTSQCDCPTG